jgi:hypothetical protein
MEDRRTEYRVEKKKEKKESREVESNLASFLLTRTRKSGSKNNCVHFGLVTHVAVGALRGVVGGWVGGRKAPASRCV